MLSLALAAGGCSFSYQLDSLFPKDQTGGKSEPTGSLRQAVNPSLSAMPPETDLVIARAAVSEVLSKGGKDTSVPWENPRTGARGTITPIKSAYNQDGFTCRDFLASYVRNGAEAWLHGEACRLEHGQWEVRNLRPWQRT